MDQEMNLLQTSDSAGNRRWYAMPVSEQLLNVGSEVHRAIRWKNRQNPSRAAGFCNKAIEFLRIMQKDPRNARRVGELEEAIFELQDYFLGDNIYNTTDEILIRYYDAFLSNYEKR